MFEEGFHGVLEVVLGDWGFSGVVWLSGHGFPVSEYVPVGGVCVVDEVGEVFGFGSDSVFGEAFVVPEEVVDVGVVSEYVSGESVVFEGEFNVFVGE